MRRYVFGSKIIKSHLLYQLIIAMCPMLGEQRGLTDGDD
jgi:hypothetical protein